MPIAATNVTTDAIDPRTEKKANNQEEWNISVWREFESAIALTSDILASKLD